MLYEVITCKIPFQHLVDVVAQEFQKFRFLGGQLLLRTRSAEQLLFRIEAEFTDLPLIP